MSADSQSVSTRLPADRRGRWSSWTAAWRNRRRSEAYGRLETIERLEREARLARRYGEYLTALERARLWR